MATCEAEFCANWTGMGCACDVMGIEPEAAQHNDGCGCDGCCRPSIEEMDRG